MTALFISRARQPIQLCSTLTHARGTSKQIKSGARALEKLIQSVLLSARNLKERNSRDVLVFEWFLSPFESPHPNSGRFVVQVRVGSLLGDFRQEDWPRLQAPCAKHSHWHKRHARKAPSLFDRLARATQRAD